MRVYLWMCLWTALCFVGIGACSRDGADDSTGTGATSPDSETSSTSDGPRDTTTPSDDGGTGSATDTDTLGTDTFESCAGVTQEATLSVLPADIILVVDNSGSMTDEAAEVRQNLNDFSAQIVGAGVDARVTLVSAFKDERNNGICVEPPLGSGACPDDSKAPAYVHVDLYITSHYGPKWVLDEYDAWKDRLRQGAMVHFVFVSDDNPYTESQEFIDRLALLDPPITSFMVHSIASSLDPEVACDISDSEPCCEFSVNEGVIYKELSSTTGGVFGDLCAQEFQGVFDELATKVTQNALACAWPMPTPPAGEALDPGKVNVVFEDESHVSHEIGWVETAADCAGVESGWYYDDPSNPKSMTLCPKTCDWVRGEASGRLEVALGCETESAKPI